MIDETIERCAKVAEDYWPSIIRCKKTGDAEHVRLHVEFKWCQAIAAAIREQKDLPRG